MTARPSVAKILEHDPELGSGLDEERLRSAVEHARARVISLPRGTWTPTDWPASTEHGLGLLVLDGLLLRRVRLHDRSGAELLGPGDLLRPWQREDAIATLPRRSGWEALRRSRIAVLDVEFVRRIGPYPELFGQLAARALRRSRHLAINMAIVHQPKVETRLHMLLWDLADRWGTVRPDGVFIPLRLTHEVLAALVAARRPTVTAALGALERLGAVRRVEGGWLLHGDPPGELTA